MDNRIFNVNGSGEEMLLATLELAFRQSGTVRCRGWMLSDKGLVLTWTTGANITAMVVPEGVTAQEVLPLVAGWLRSEQAKKIPCEGWDADASHDGSNGIGWRVFCEDWGHVAGRSEAICCIKPAYMWYGK